MNFIEFKEALLDADEAYGISSDSDKIELLEFLDASFSSFKDGDLFDVGVSNKANLRDLKEFSFKLRDAGYTTKGSSEDKLIFKSDGEGVFGLTKARGYLFVITNKEFVENK